QTKGWSFLVYLLPNMAGYCSLEGGPSLSTGDPSAVDMASKSVNAAAMNTAIPEFICPSNPFASSPYQNPNTTPPQGALTNYKAMAATHAASLNVLAGGPAPYPAPSNPDGAMPPSPTGVGTQISDLVDGASQTILLAETIETTNSSHVAAARWTVGAEVFLCGMKNSEVGTPVQPFGSYWAPAGFDGTFGTGTGRCYLNYQFGVVAADTYEAPNASIQPSPPMYGPSSGHASVVNHLMGDGSVQPLNKNLFIEIYFFLITKNDGDPFVISGCAAGG
ncbi:MAG: DUF1559 domain-containing protein, partial [Thermoguttaceae bacterium]